jgi:hypothetical protein
MAMNKKEQAEHQSLIDEIMLLKAWRLTVPVERDLPPPSGYGAALTKGWDFNAYSNQIYKACSSNMCHGTGWERTSTQQPSSLFSTPELAYAALRYAVEQEYIKRLASIDKAASNHSEAAP